MTGALRSLSLSVRRWPWLVPAGLALLGVAAYAIAALRPGRHLAAARQALRRHDLDTARAALAQYLRDRPHDPQALLLAAQTARRGDDHAEAERLLQAFDSAHPDPAASNLEWALLAAQQGDLAAQGREQRLLSLVEEGSPDAELVLEALAKGYRNTLRWSRMVECLGRLLERDPGHVPALVLRGQGLIGLRQPGRALDDFRRAALLSPDNAAARLGLADTLHRLGYPEAARHYETLCKRQPPSPQALLGLARCHFDSARLDDAWRVLDRLLGLHPDDTAGLLERGRLALLRGQPEEARQAFARANAPWHRELHTLLGQALEELGRPDEAERYRQRLRAIEAADVALARLSLDYRRDPRDAGLRYRIGWHLLGHGQEEMGLRWLWTALLHDSRHAPTHRALAEHFERVGQPLRADHHRRQAGSSPGEARP